MVTVGIELTACETSSNTSNIMDNKRWSSNEKDKKEKDIKDIELWKNIPSISTVFKSRLARKEPGEDNANSKEEEQQLVQLSISMKLRQKAENHSPAIAGPPVQLLHLHLHLSPTLMRMAETWWRECGGPIRVQRLTGG
ncbi:uncharacterized protein LOC122982006 isoform X3 [Thunnus albacares]|uniref:uncharacterized protein LOC122982006 isoform X3 n=1 Tax=Thunnus albacares TaxID=8236 RepID=UPI001CF680EF|nr:uncharacterized protein LOC122982006 isoform X3 [Thunnus albacares]